MQLQMHFLFDHVVNHQAIVILEKHQNDEEEVLLVSICNIIIM